MKKTFKIIAWVVLILLVLLFGGQWWLGNKIRKTIEEKVYQETQGNTRIQIKTVQVRLIGRTVRLKDIRITSDSTRPAPADHPVKYVNAYIRNLEIKGIHFKKQDSVLHIRARKFGIDISSLSLIAQHTGSSDIPGKKNGFSDKRKKKLMQLELKRTDIRLGDIGYENIQDQDTVNYILHDFYTRVDSLSLHSVPGSATPFYSCSDIRLSFSSFRNFFAQKSQLLAVDTFSLQGKEGLVSAADIRLLPQYSKEIFALKAPGHTDWTEIQTGKIACYRFDMQSLLKEQLLRIDSVSLQKATIRSFKNRQIAQKPRIKKLFYESVQQFPYPLAIRSIRLHHIDVEYQELAEHADFPGTVTFEGLSGTFSGLTNIPKARQPYFTLTAQGKLMDQGLLEATFHLPVDSTENHFRIEGRLGSMEMPSLNPAIVPLANIKITSGKINEMTFRITGNDRKAQVDMVLLYENLKIRIVKEKDGHFKTRSFLSTLANGLIINNNNPDRNRSPRQGEGSAERDLYRSQFNYLWKTLLAGLKSSVGL